MKSRILPGGLALGLVLAPAIHAGDDVAAREKAAKQATQELVQRLGERLKTELTTGGAQQAISVCRDVAPQIAGELSRRNGWRVTRVGTRVRNPMLGSPDAWEQTVLDNFQKRIAQGEKLAELSYSEVVNEPSGKYFRFMKAMGTQELCLNCHGNAEQIAEPVRMELKTHYPFDQATGYAAGDLRGAVSIKQPMDIPLIGATGN